jgi:hypothetical protein
MEKRCVRSAHASAYPWVNSVLLGANGLAPHCSPSFHAFVCCYRELSTEKTSFIVAHPVCCPHKAGQHRSWWGCSCFPCWPWRLTLDAMRLALRKIHVQFSLIHQRARMARMRSASPPCSVTDGVMAVMQLATLLLQQVAQIAAVSFSLT